MTLMIIAIGGILLGFACVLVGFFMEGAARHHAVEAVHSRRVHVNRNRAPVRHRKAA